MTLLSFRKTFIGAAAALAIGGAGVASAFNGVNVLSNGTFDTNVNGWGHHAGRPFVACTEEGRGDYSSQGRRVKAPPWSGVMARK